MLRGQKLTIKVLVLYNRIAIILNTLIDFKIDRKVLISNNIAYKVRKRLSYS